MKVLFVCLGNICRSPMAEGVFNKLVNERGLEEKFYSTSAGTADYHIGQSPDARTKIVCDLNKAPIEHKGRKFEKEDLKEFDLILAMDGNNLKDILSLVNENDESRKKVKLLRSYEPNGERKEVPDPYYGNLDDFKTVYSMLVNACNHLLNTLEK